MENVFSRSLLFVHFAILQLAIGIGSFLFASVVAVLAFHFINAPVNEITLVPAGVLFTLLFAFIAVAEINFLKNASYVPVKA